MSRNSPRTAPTPPAPPKPAQGDSSSTDADKGGDSGALGAGASSSGDDRPNPSAPSFAERLERGLAGSRADIEAALARAAAGDNDAAESLLEIRAIAEQALMLIGAPAPEPEAAPEYVPVGEVRELSVAERDGRTVRVLTDGVRTWKEAGE